MNKYLLKLIKYAPEGYLTTEVSLVKADTAQDLSDKYTKYNNMHFVTHDEEGHEIIGNKMYQVHPMQEIFVEISDFNSFCTINGIVR